MRVSRDRGSADAFDVNRGAIAQVYAMGEAYGAGWNNKALRGLAPHERLLIVPGADVRGSFAARWLEPLTLTSPWAVVLFWQPIACYLLYSAIWVHGGTLSGVGCVYAIALLFGWPATEYLLHRFVFHMPVRWARGWGPANVVQFLAHGVHHKHPTDPLRVCTPLSMSIPIAAMLLPAFLFTMGTVDAYAWCAGFMQGYLVYDITHALLHLGNSSLFPAWTRPLPQWFARLRKLHKHHHYAEDGHLDTFGVSHTLWDEVFRTPMPATTRGDVAAQKID